MVQPIFSFHEFFAVRNVPLAPAFRSSLVLLLLWLITDASPHRKSTHSYYRKGVTSNEKINKFNGGEFAAIVDNIYPFLHNHHYNKHRILDLTRDFSKCYVESDQKLKPSNELLQEAEGELMGYLMNENKNYLENCKDESDTKASIESNYEAFCETNYSKMEFYNKYIDSCTLSGDFRGIVYLKDYIFQCNTSGSTDYVNDFVFYVIQLNYPFCLLSSEVEPTCHSELLWNLEYQETKKAADNEACILVAFDYKPLLSNFTEPDSTIPISWNTCVEESGKLNNTKLKNSTTTKKFYTTEANYYFKQCNQQTISTSSAIAVDNDIACSYDYGTKAFYDSYIDDCGDSGIVYVRDYNVECFIENNNDHDGDIINVSYTSIYNEMILNDPYCLLASEIEPTCKYEVVWKHMHHETLKMVNDLRDSMGSSVLCMLNEFSFTQLFAGANNSSDVDSTTSDGADNKISLLRCSDELAKLEKILPFDLIDTQNYILETVEKEQFETYNSCQENVIYSQTQPNGTNKLQCFYDYSKSAEIFMKDSFCECDKAGGIFYLYDGIIDCSFLAPTTGANISYTRGWRSFPQCMPDKLTCTSYMVEGMFKNFTEKKAQEMKLQTFDEICTTLVDNINISTYSSNRESNDFCSENNNETLDPTTPPPSNSMSLKSSPNSFGIGLVMVSEVFLYYFGG